MINSKVREWRSAASHCPPIRFWLCRKEQLHLVLEPTSSLGIFPVGAEEVKGAREGSRPKDGDISGAFGATLSPQDLPAALAFPEMGHTLSRWKGSRNLWGVKSRRNPGEFMNRFGTLLHNIRVSRHKWNDNDPKWFVHERIIILFLAKNHEVCAAPCFLSVVARIGSFSHISTGACCRGRVKTCYRKHLLFFSICLEQYVFCRFGKYS